MAKKPISRLAGRSAIDGRFRTVEWARQHKDNAIVERLALPKKSPHKPKKS